MKAMTALDLTHVAGGYYGNDYYPPTQPGLELIGWRITGYSETTHYQVGLYWDTETILREPILEPLYSPRYVETVTYITTY